MKIGVDLARREDIYATCAYVRTPLGVQIVSNENGYPADFSDVPPKKVLRAVGFFIRGERDDT